MCLRGDATEIGMVGMASRSRNLAPPCSRGGSDPETLNEQVPGRTPRQLARIGLSVTTSAVCMRAVVQLVIAAALGHTAEVCRLVGTGRTSSWLLRACARAALQRFFARARPPRDARLLCVFRSVAALRFCPRHTGAALKRSPSSCVWAQIPTRRKRARYGRAACIIAVC